MKVSQHFTKDSQIPYILADNVLEENFLPLLWDELNFLSRDLDTLEAADGASGSASRIDENGEKVLLKNNKCLFVDSFYTDHKKSSVLKVGHNAIFNEEFLTQVVPFHPWFRYLFQNCTFSTLLSYYDDGTYYEPHQDTSVLSALIWFYKEPKKFRNGEFVIEGTETIECVNNRMVLIPGTAIHEVKTVELEEEDRDCRLGRYTITLFISPSANREEPQEDNESKG
tara:strand:- start:1561 stop:2238 length:678 start_codon:yes stop_codon:yes gene_type:complete